MKFKFVFLSFTALILFACSDSKGPTDTATSGNITIAADESLKPIIDAQIEVFESIYANAHINVIYTNEYEAMRLLGIDSARLAIVTRDLYPEEKKPLDELKIRTRNTTIAYDAIAFIMHPENKDTVLTTGQIQKILSEEYQMWSDIRSSLPKEKIQVVFDSPKSGAVRMLKDSLLSNAELGKNCFAVQSNPEVIEYVSNNKYAIGIIGVSWISDSDDSLSVSFTQKVKVAELVPADPENAEAATMKPFQAYIALKQYPFWRQVQIVSREGRMGLGTGFASFVASDRGQRIILKSGLVPALAPVRLVQINNQPL
jgi:phosphate transport system substrate-binding protein